MRKKQFYSSFFYLEDKKIFLFLAAHWQDAVIMGAAGQASVERHHGLPHSSYSWFDLSPTKSPRTQLSPSVSAGVLSKIRVKRLKTARYRKKKKNERDQREYQSQSRKGKSTMLEKIL